MTKFEPRLAAPAASDKNWIHADHGGYNLCIHISGGSVLPNCVGYAWGRWRELLGKYHNLALTDAEPGKDQIIVYRIAKQRRRLGAVRDLLAVDFWL